MKSNRSESVSSAYGNRIRVSYIIALSIVAVISIASLLYTRTFLAEQQSDGKVVNISGRQRFLSQQLTKCVLALKQDTLLETREKWIKQAETALERWRKQHKGLQSGDAQLGLPGNNSAEVQGLFASIANPFTAMATAVEEILAAHGASNFNEVYEKNLPIILQNEELFLQGMEKVVYRYAEEATDKVNRLQTIQVVLLGISLLSLILSALLIFEPLVRRINSNAREMEAKNHEIQMANEEAITQNEELRQTSEELHATVEHLKEAQTELVEREKMASLGSMVAGIAHEVNTPLGISVSLVSNLEHQTNMLLENLNSNQIKRSELVKTSANLKESSSLLMVHLQRAADLIQSFKKVAVNQSAEEVPMEFGLNTMLLDVMNTMRPELKKCQAIYDISGDEEIKMITLPSAIF